MSGEEYLDPAMVARYVDRVEIGRGGMGVVLAARDRQLDRKVAIKVMHATEFGGGRARERFLEEGRICSQMLHENVVRIYDYGAPEKFPPYMVFEFIEGRSLFEILESRDLSGDEAFAVLLGIAKGLAHAHGAGVIHRDLKPENILIEEGFRAKVADFGLAKDYTSSSGVRTQQGILLGTPPYMCPEYIRGEKAQAPADTYALGVLAYRLFTGELPYDDQDPMKLLRRHVKDPIPDPRRANPRICDELATVITTCLAKEPGQRYADMGAVVAALGAAQRAQTRYGPIRTSGTSSGRHKGPIGTGDPTVAASGTRGRFRIPAPDEAPSLLRSRPFVLGSTLTVALLGIGLAHQLWTGSQVSVSGFRVYRSPRALRIEWQAAGPVDLRVTGRGAAEGKDLRRAPEIRPVPGGSVGLVRHLDPETDYLIELRQPWTGRAVETVAIQTPPDRAPPKGRIEVGRNRPPVVLSVRPGFDAGLTWTAEVEAAGGARRKVSGGDPDALAEDLRIPLEGLDPMQRVRLAYTLHPAGEDPREPVEILRGRTPLATALEEALTPLSQEALGKALSDFATEVQDRRVRRTEYPPEPERHLVDAGIDPSISTLGSLLPRLLGTPDVPLLDRTEAECTALPLAFFDVVLEGNAYPGAFRLREARMGYLPHGPASTLAEGGRLLATVFHAQAQGGPLAVALFPSGYEDEVASRNLRLLGSGSLASRTYGDDDENFRKFQENGSQVRMDFELEEDPPRELELAIRSLSFVRRYFLVLEVEGRGRVALWSHEAESAQHELVPSPEGSPGFYRLPPGLLVRGRNRLVFRLVDWPGKDGFLVPVRLLEVTIRAGA